MSTYGSTAKFSTRPSDGRVVTYPFLEAPRPFAIAYRGGGGERPEDTMEAFRHAVGELGFPALEIDVWAAQSGELYIWHGARRDWAQRGFIPDAVIESGAPRLGEVLAEFPTTRFLLDPKDWAVAEPLARMVVEADAIDRVMIASVSDHLAAKTVEQIYRLSGRRVCLTTYYAFRRLWLRSLVSLTEPWQSEFPCYSFSRRLISSRLVETAHAGGARVIVWRVETSEQMKKMLDWGVDGVMTKYPHLLKAVLQERGEWLERIPS